MSYLGQVCPWSSSLPGERLAPSTVGTPAEQPEGWLVLYHAVILRVNAELSTHHSYWHAEDQQQHNWKYADAFLLLEAVVSTKSENMKKRQISEYAHNLKIHSFSTNCSFDKHASQDTYWATTLTALHQ